MFSYISFPVLSFPLPSFLPSFLASLLPCFLASLLPCFLASLLPCFLASLLPCFLASLLACFLPSFLLSCLPSFLPSFRPPALPSLPPSFSPSLPPLPSLRRKNRINYFLIPNNFLILNKFFLILNNLFLIRIPPEPPSEKKKEPTEDQLSQILDSLKHFEVHEFPAAALGVQSAGEHPPGLVGSGAPKATLGGDSWGGGGGGGREALGV